jgi:hypothetical protein
MPAAVLGARRFSGLDVIDAAYAIPLALALGAGAIATSRVATRRDALTLGRSGGRRAARVGRLLGIVGVLLAVTALISLAVFGVLEYMGSR